MKKLTLLLTTVLFLQAQGYVIQVPTETTNTRTSPVGWVHIQKLLLPLFENVCEESTDPIVIRLNEEFKLDPSYGFYLKPDVIENFQNLKATKGMLAKGEIFTEYDSDHLNELKVIYDVLYYAKDFDTFYKAASWARQNVNCGLFVDAIYLAILSRRDTEKITIPAPYEILPNYFIRKDYIIEASSLIRGETFTLPEWVRNEGNAYILDVNYTTNYYDDTDDKLAYFHEDIGLNSYYYLNRLKKLPWITNLRNLQCNNCGEQIYHSMKQMMSRYNLERYSNGLFELEGIDWDYINEYSYDPMLIYSNGNEFSQRRRNNDNSEILMMLKNIENGLPTVVAHMRDGGYNKSEIINHLMEILVTGEKSYESLALQFLGVDKIITSVPSTLEHYMTTIRDPIFWKLNKKIVDLVDKALQVLPSYTRSQLYFPGVVVQNVEVKKIMTSFDNFEFDVTSALKSEGEDVKFQVKINQPRLNHKPFTFKITISSQVAQKSLIKLYLGPKVMPGELVEKKNMFMLLDCFEFNLKIGSNVVTRSSNDMMNLSDDLTSLETLHKKVLDAEFGLDTLLLKSVWSQLGFPSRLILPKGTPEGLPIHLFVFVAPYVKATVGGPRNTLDLNLDAILSPGYPLDLSVEIQQLFNLPNALVKDIVITHKTEGAYNKASNAYNTPTNDNIWQSSDVEYIRPNGPLSLSTRPAFTKKTFDYKSKKNQYGKKNDYASKKDEIKQDTKTKEFTNEVEASTKLSDEKIPDNMEVINNIYITPELEHDKSAENIMDKNNMYYKISPDYIYDNSDVYFTPSDLIDTSNYNKVVEKDYKIKPHRLLKAPKKKFSNIFNIVFKPIKPDEDVYE
ncbi:larval serum protein 1 beta chain-like [Nymphalis io]|uniref:larval serum protein 1 beta chain-like n=1 Tax=Inachis io TaxID=171585 RepID=UPI00216A08F5|nr:larval serum protein 1 beta chain-like [Nymphalis io]